MVANTTSSRRRPYPYDMYVGTVRVMLEPEADGNLVAQKTKTLDSSAPVDFTYSSANPFKERTFEWTKLFGGFGQTVEPDTVPRRYEHGEFVDTSINGLIMKGPRFETHTATIAATAGEVRQLIFALHGGVETLFAICQNGVYRRVAGTPDTWAASLIHVALGGSLPDAQTCQSALRYKHRDTTTPANEVDGLYLGTSSGNLWQYNGTTWSEAVLAQGPGLGATQGEARWLEKTGDELWVAGDYWVVKLNNGADPMARTSWAAPIWIGDKSARITFLRMIDNSVYIFKEDGIYTVSDTGIDQEVFPTLRGKRGLRNGRNATVWLDKIWIPYGDQTFTLDGSGNLKADGMEQMLENSSDIRGRWAAGAGHNTWFLYEIYYNEQTTTSHLVKHGTWIDQPSANALPGLAQFADAHHGALYSWDKEATSCFVASGIHANGRDRLYVGFADGTVEWCILPRNTPNPAEDGVCEFTTQTSYVYLPLHHAGYRADYKHYRGISVVGPNVTNTEWVEVEYRTDIVNEFADWMPVDVADPYYTLPNQRKNFALETAPFGQAIQLRVKLLKDPTPGASPAHASPIIDGIAVHQAIRPAMSLEYVFSVRAASFLPKLNRTTDRRRGSQIREAILAECAKIGPVAVRLPSGEVEELTLIDYRESAKNRMNRRDHEWLIQVTGIQLRTLSQSITAPSGLTYATLETYTVGQLESII